jgi:malate dehydrogenase
MDLVAILGAGELGATLARRVAEAEMARRVVLVDADEGRARGKALDLLQSGPVEGYDTAVEGRGALVAADAPDVVVVADPPELLDVSAGAARIYGGGLVPLVGKGLLIVAGGFGPTVIEAAVEKGLSRERTLGTAPLAWAGALRRRLADELRVRASDVSLTLLGLPPAFLVLPQGGATVGGVPVDAVSVVARRRALESLRRRRLGPVALASAAAQVLGALAARSRALLPLFVRLDGEYGHRRVALATPVQLGEGRMESVVELALDPVDRVALDNAAQRRFEGEEA